MNYSPVKTGVQTQTRGILFEAATDGIPTIDHLTFQEVEFVNSRSGVFRRGELRFEEDKQDEIFNQLHYPDWKKVLLSEDDVKNLVVNPNKENAERIVAIKDSNTIERVRGIMNSLINQQFDVSTKIKSIINKRFEELQNGKITSEIVVGKISSPAASEESLTAMQEELSQMRELLAQMRAEKETAASVDKDTEVKTLPKNKPKTK